MNINMKDFVKNDIAYLPGAFLSLWLVCTFPIKMTAQISDSIRTKDIDEVVVKAKMHSGGSSSPAAARWPTANFSAKKPDLFPRPGSPILPTGGGTAMILTAGGMRGWPICGRSGLWISFQPMRRCIPMSSNSWLALAKRGRRTSRG